MSVTIQNSSPTHAYAFRGPGNQSQIGSRAGSQSKMRRQRSTIADLVTVMRAIGFIQRKKSDWTQQKVESKVVIITLVFTSGGRIIDENKVSHNLKKVMIQI